LAEKLKEPADGKKKTAFSFPCFVLAPSFLCQQSQFFLQREHTVSKSLTFHFFFCIEQAEANSVVQLQAFVW